MSDDVLALAGLTRDDLLTIRNWSLSVEHTLSPGEERILAEIDAALRSEEQPNRWAAFTDDELKALANGIAQIQILRSDLGRSAVPEEALREQMEAEITRRKDEA